MLDSDQFDAVTDRRYVFRIDGENFMDGSNHLHDNNGGIFIQDGFDDKLQNVAAQCYMTGGEVRPFVGFYATRKLIPAEELFHRYGKSYWSYEENHHTLTKAQRVKCAKYYQMKQDDWIPTLRYPNNASKKKPQASKTAVQEKKKSAKK